MYQPNEIRNTSVLISPLDWGFGHTTRTLALINKLILQNNQIVFAGNRAQVNFIKKEIPAIFTVHLEGYEFKFNPNRSLYLQVFLQSLKLSRAIKKEKAWLDLFLRNNKVEYIISDNRYGLHNKKAKSILLTHQTNLQVPFGKNLINSLLKRKIEQFNACWIPDYKDQRLSGKLSNHNLRIPTYFIGPLSRFNTTKAQAEAAVYDFLFIVTGPSPHREKLLKQVLSFTSTHPYKCAVIANSKPEQNTVSKNTHFDYNPTTQILEDLILNSEIIVTKCGYTSVMELYSMHKKTYYLSSKRQYEQQYLHQIHQIGDQAQFKELDKHFNI